jgi:hypothetical protein
MARRGSRRVRTAIVLAVMGASVGLGAADLVWRWRVAGPEEIIDLSARVRRSGDERMARSAEEGLHGGGAMPLPPLPVVAADPRLAPLRRAAESWRRSTGPRRVVVDQVCLVPDVPSFFEAIAAWDDRHYFPILIDEPAWTLPFLRAFRPARVVRFAGRGDAGASSVAVDRWRAAVTAVSRGWSPPSAPEDALPPAGAPPHGLGPTPPGVVLSSPDSPTLAGAVALAAGRFQPMIRLEPELWALDDSVQSRAVRYGDVLTLSQAWRFAQHIEAHVASIAPRYAGLGDDCDFLTIAADWPYRYDNMAEGGSARGIHSLDDLIGRVLVGGLDAQGLSSARRRWAFTGRLVGDPAASVATAMGALFLAPDLALFWDTYAPGTSYSDYSAAPAGRIIAQSRLVPRAVLYAAGPGATLASWDRIMDPWNKFGLIWVNSSGGPRDFSIDGGPGRPADVPGGRPAAVVMIHSFSAANPADPTTIAGRWLLHGAFVYCGSVNEPFLQAFRKPGLVADLAVQGIPLSAALRQGESEPFGRPWRLIFLGDPLYRLPAPRPPEGKDSLDVASQSSRIKVRNGRLDPELWRELSPDYADWLALDVEAPSEDPASADSDQPADRSLYWCRDSAIVEQAGGASAIAPAGGAPAAGRTVRDWRAVLKGIRREQLDRRLRPIWDELLIDALSQSGEWDELASRLARIPPAELRPRAWAALENGAVFRLARAARDPDRRRARDRARQLLDEVARSPWPGGSTFPSQFAARAEAIK